MTNRSGNVRRSGIQVSSWVCPAVDLAALSITLERYGRSPLRAGFFLSQATRRGRRTASGLASIHRRPWWGELIPLRSTVVA